VFHYLSAAFLPLELGPIPGPDFVTRAVELGDSAPVFKGSGRNKALVSYGPQLEELYRQAVYSPMFYLSVTVKNVRLGTETIPGHPWGLRNYQPAGPVPAEVMIVGKNPGTAEMQQKRNLIGESGSLLREILSSLGYTDQETDSWYVTNLVKHPNLDPSSNRLSAGTIANWMPVLYQELGLVRPRLILCLGKEAAAAVLGESVSLQESARRTFRIHLPPSPEQLADLERASARESAETAEVVVCTHPAAVLHNPEYRDQVVAGLSWFFRVHRGRTDDNRPRDWRVVRFASELSEIIREVMKDPAPVLFLDAEWQGASPELPGSYLRTLQFSHKPGFACCIVVREVGGRENTTLPHEDLRRLLRVLFTPTETYRPRAAGHNFRADLPWLIHFDPLLGDLVLNAFRAADSPELSRTHGGIDTMLLAHAYRETGYGGAKFALDSVCMELVGSPNWSVDLENWKREYCAAAGISSDELGGYGDCPDEVLYPYAMADVDYPRELIEAAIRPGGLLDCDRYGQSSWVPFWRSMRSSPAFFEMEQTGIHVDMTTASQLIEGFQSAGAELLTQLREEARWPEFNPGSVQQCKELLFGERYNGKKTLQRLRPEEAVSLYLEPIRTSGKPSKDWHRLSDAEKLIYAPSTDKEVLGILKQLHPLVDLLRKYRFISQVLKTTLRPPGEGPDGFTETDEDGNPIFADGLLSFVRPNHRVHTCLFPTQETGRCSSVRPPLTTLGKRREGDYKKILGDRYKHPIRSILTATPPAADPYPEDPWVLVDFDLRGAELYMTGIQSQDHAMIDHCRRNNLPETDPNFYDIHSSMAVFAFGLNCEASKKALQAAGKGFLRDAAKTLIFGLLYGRGDDAILRAIMEETKEVTLDQVKRLRAAVLQRYPRLKEFFAGAGQRVVEPGFIRNCFGRLRRFAPSNDREVLAKLQREAGNFPIQSAIADVVHEWMYALESRPDRYTERGPRYRLLLQVHDAMVAECRLSSLDWFVKEVVPGSLASIPVYACDFDGRRRLGVPPYFLNTEISVHLRWGVKLTTQEREQLGITL